MQSVPALFSLIWYVLRFVSTPAHASTTCVCGDFKRLLRWLRNAAESFEKPRRHHYANAAVTITLLKRRDVTVKTSASYHCSPTNTLINPLSIWWKETDGEGPSPGIYAYLRKLDKMYTHTHTPHTHIMVC